MSDEEEEFESDEEREVIQLGQEEVEQILNWGMHVASIITLMLHNEEVTDDQKGKLKLEAWEQAVTALYHEMPECLVDPSHQIAHSLMDFSDFTEEAVAELMNDLKDLGL